MFTFTVFEILLSENRLGLSLAQRGTASERVKVAVKNQKNIGNLLKFLGKWLTYKLSRFWMVSRLFWFCLKLFIAGKIEKLDFWDSNDYRNYPNLVRTENNYFRGCAP